MFLARTLQSVRGCSSQPCLMKPEGRVSPVDCFISCFGSSCVSKISSLGQDNWVKWPALAGRTTSSSNTPKHLISRWVFRLCCDMYQMHGFFLRRPPKHYHWNSMFQQPPNRSKRGSKMFVGWYSGHGHPCFPIFWNLSGGLCQLKTLLKHTATQDCHRLPRAGAPLAWGCRVAGIWGAGPARYMYIVIVCYYVASPHKDRKLTEIEHIPWYGYYAASPRKDRKLK